MDMRRNMSIYFFICRLVDREKEWDGYKMKIGFKKGRM
jgi:hypothetical protein